MQKMKKLVFLLDVDGVMTTGQFIYSQNGKVFKVFGPHDHDGLKILKDKLTIKFITADEIGFNITRKRIVEDMGCDLDLVPEADRYNYIFTSYDFENLIYMGDGYFDVDILKNSMLGIAPKSARREARAVADYITESNAGDGAVLDACLMINKKFFMNDEV